MKIIKYIVALSLSSSAYAADGCYRWRLSSAANISQTDDVIIGRRDLPYFVPATFTGNKIKCFIDRGTINEIALFCATPGPRPTNKTEVGIFAQETNSIIFGSAGENHNIIIICDSFDNEEPARPRHSTKE